MGSKKVKKQETQGKVKKSVVSDKKKMKNILLDPNLYNHSHM